MYGIKIRRRGRRRIISKSTKKKIILNLKYELNE